MIRNETRRHRIAVLSAAAVVVLLAGLFAVRVVARPGLTTTPGASATVEIPAAPHATVPPPRPLSLADLPTPFSWAGSENQNAPLEFQIDLDYLAPLGTGSANAAVWFKDFSIKNGARFETEGRKVYSKRFEEHFVGDRTWKVLPGGDPFLLEAEPWVDQATCSFYPEIYEVNGMHTDIPNLLTMIDLSRSWVYRGMSESIPELAKEDFRRAIRLGRLLRQDDVTIIQDLVALACIRLGAEALYDLAREEGDAATMVATSLVLADKDAMRLSTMQRISMTDAAFRIEKSDSGEAELDITDDQLEKIVKNVRTLPDRRFRMEALVALQIVKHLGTEAQKEKTVAALDDLTGDPDPLFADTARRFRDVPLDPKSFLYFDDE